MKRLSLAAVFALLPLSLAVAGQEATHQCPINWIGRNTEVEDMLQNAEIVSVEDVGMGVTKPSRVELKDSNGVTFGAAFKPIKRGRQKGFWESYEAEIAAYELDKILGMGMVPPTVKRTVNNQTGSLQYWVNDCKLYKEIADQTPPHPAEWSHQLSTMKLFDILIMNKDRNAQNFLVDPGWDVVLIDHSRGFITEKNITKDEGKLPVQFDRTILEKVRALNQEELEAAMKDLLTGGQVKSILERRDALLEYYDKLVKKQGEARTLFN